MTAGKRPKRPLNPEAVQAADAALNKKTGGRPLTISPEDVQLRREWIDAYLAAGGQSDDEDWGEEESDSIVESCPSTTSEDNYEWYFSI